MLRNYISLLEGVMYTPEFVAGVRAEIQHVRKRPAKRSAFGVLVADGTATANKTANESLKKVQPFPDVPSTVMHLTWRLKQLALAHLKTVRVDQRFETEPANMESLRLFPWVEVLDNKNAIKGR